MQLDRQPEGSLVIRENPVALRGILLCLGAALLERVQFEFDVAQRRLRWRRRNPFRTLSGELPFSEIRGRAGDLRDRGRDSRGAGNARPGAGRGWHRTADASSSQSFLAAMLQSTAREARE